MKVLILLFGWVLLCSAIPCPFASSSLPYEALFDQYCSYEANFIRQLGVDNSTGFAINGVTINEMSGLPDEEDYESIKKASFATEAIHIALLIKALQSAENAEMFYSIEEALVLLERKVAGYQEIVEARESQVIDVGEDIEFWNEGLENMYWSVLALNKLLKQQYPEQTALIMSWLEFQQHLESLDLDLKIQYCIESAFYDDSPLYFYCQWVHLFLPISYYSSSFKAADIQKLHHINSAVHSHNGFNPTSKSFFSPRSLMNLLSQELDDQENAWTWLQFVLGRQGGQSQFGAVAEGDCDAGVCQLRWEEKVAPLVSIMGGFRELVKEEAEEILKEYEVNETDSKLNLDIPAPLVAAPSFHKYFTSCRPFVFPPDFKWGASISAYQYEGAPIADGSGLSIWDTFVHNKNNSLCSATGDKALRFYERHLSEIEIMKEVGLTGLRISISWSRVLPDGTTAKVNQDGVDFYKRVIQELQDRGIEVYVTLYHFDLPEELEKMGGWLNESSQYWFEEYADFAFKTFGDKVKKWVTFNEPNIFATAGYGYGNHAPGRCSEYMSTNCEVVGGGGDTTTEPYIVVHNVLLSHARAANLYKSKYQKEQNGTIGIVGSFEAAQPFDESNEEDIQAVEVYLDFNEGWIFDPIVKGDYPQSMKTLITGNRLPSFSESEKQMLKGSFDFIGINYYTATYVKYTGVVGQDFTDDGRYSVFDTNSKGREIGNLTDNGWQRVYPQGLYEGLIWMSERYGIETDFYIFETGYAVINENIDYSDGEMQIHDFKRIQYFEEHIHYLAEAMQAGVRVLGFFVWSAIDNYTWAKGYDIRFGLIYANYEEDISLTIKDSGKWFQQWINQTSSQIANKQ